MPKILVIITIISILAVARWIFNTTSGFNREFDLMNTIILVVFLVPLGLAIIFAVIQLIRIGVTPESVLSKATVIVLCAIMAPLSLAITFVPFLSPGPIRDYIYADSIRPTDDGLFEYRLELINAFQRNASARLFVRDLNSEEEMYIPIDILDGSLGGFSIPHGQSFLWGRLEPSEVSGQYIFKMPAERVQDGYIDGVRFEFLRLSTRVVGGAFLIDMNTKTAEELYRRADYRTSSRRIYYENDQLNYLYFPELIDTYINGDRTDVEVFLNITMAEPRRYNLIPLPIDIELLKSDKLRQERTSNVLWITLEETETPEQFIARTTADLSEDITYTFLIDIPSLTATRIDD